MFNPKLIKKKEEQYSEELHRDDAITFLHRLVHGNSANPAEKCSTVDVRFLVVSNLDPTDMGYVYDYMHSYLEQNKGYYIVNYETFSNYIPEYYALNKLIDLSELMKVTMDKKSCIYEVLLTFDNEGKLENSFVRVLPIINIADSSNDLLGVKLGRIRH